MKKTLLQEKYPVLISEISKNETTCQSMDSVVAYYKEKIAGNPRMQFIGVFDHYAHTQNIGGKIAPDIQGAVNVIFCFGFALPNPQVLTMRPRSIGVTDFGDKFVVSFLVTSMKPVNEAMEAWANGLRNNC